MKVNRIFLSIIISVLILAIILTGVYILYANVYKDYRQNLDYTESTLYIQNPDQGFYRPAFIKLSPNTHSANTPLYNDIQLYHLRIDISDFSKAVNGEDDLPLTESALNELDRVLQYYKDNQRNVIVRFSYDPYFEGNANCEPFIEMIISHIMDISTILNGYTEVITAIEVGMIGPWGEMHTSTMATSDNISRLIDAYLTHTDYMSILVRTPQMIYNYLGITLDDIDKFTISEQSLAYRLGLFNDGYLGSDTDLGTYDDRERETQWLSNQTAHLPYGGEVTSPSSSLHDIDKCLPEMFLMNLSYLNYEWNDQVVQDKWASSYYTINAGNDKLFYGQTAYQYIASHLGYRFVLTDSVFTYKNSLNKLNISLTIQNKGFGNLNRTKDATIILVDDLGNKESYSIGKYNGENKINAEMDLKLQKGKYKVYLSLAKIDTDGNFTYSIAFANNNIYDEDLQANYIGTITK